MTEQAPTVLSCSKCGEQIDCCAFCDEESCQALICYECLTVALGERTLQPHAHGG